MHFIEAGGPFAVRPDARALEYVGFGRQHGEILARQGDGLEGGELRGAELGGWHHAEALEDTLTGQQRIDPAAIAKTQMPDKVAAARGWFPSNPASAAEGAATQQRLLGRIQHPFRAQLQLLGNVPVLAGRRRYAR
ncbi:MAG: hypothetical protein U0793_18485 [Gemmataceae bacterium]